MNHMEFINNFQIKNNQLIGVMTIPNLYDSVEFSFNIEKKAADISDFKELINKSKDFIIQLDKNKISKITTFVSEEITDAAYEGIDYEYSKQDIYKLKNDLKIKRINFYNEDMIIFFESNKIFTEMKISCQMDYEFNIEDITVG
ncbi:hypothetical protein C4S77_00140 [Apibacter adventoris]|uniref:DUF2262 domain-containing protein n=2 Tax=Apibacter adventoris TaxID=1679466 RepID=A0A2S8AFU0_9FLAO|nr:hypothetical protein C4S77_00140 [Apibacter adventoris]